MSTLNYKILEVVRFEEYSHVKLKGAEGVKLSAEKGEEGYLFKWEGSNNGEYLGDERNELIDEIRNTTDLSGLGAEHLVGTAMYHLEP